MYFGCKPKDSYIKDESKGACWQAKGKCGEALIEENWELSKGEIPRKKDTEKRYQLDRTNGDRTILAKDKYETKDCKK